MNLLAIFLTGLTTGGLSCLAMQGGLLASVIANQKERADRSESTESKDVLPVTLFLVAKLISHTALGFLLGWLGSQVELSLSARLVFQGIAALFMLATAANLLNVHPIFRYVVLQPPKFLQKLIRKTVKGDAVFTPAVLGFLTIFVPCGVTQAMEVLAVTSGNPIFGALIMFFFVLGTSPLFAIVGLATAKLSEKFQSRFLKIAALTLIYLGLSSLNGILVVLDSPITFQKVTRPVIYFFSNERYERMYSTPVNQGVQKALIHATNNGYSPKVVRVKAGVPVELTVQTKETYTCASWFRLKAFNIQLTLGPNDSQTTTFTPTEKGTYQFTCAMGMYTGILEVQ